MERSRPTQIIGREQAWRALRRGALALSVAAGLTGGIWFKHREKMVPTSGGWRELTEEELMPGPPVQATAESPLTVLRQIEDEATGLSPEVLSAIDNLDTLGNHPTGGIRQPGPDNTISG